MALIINREVETKYGLTIPAGTYVHITEFFINKSAPYAQIGCAYFINKTARLNNKAKYIPSGLTTEFSLDITISELENSALFDIIYSKLKIKLQAIYGQNNIIDDLDPITPDARIRNIITPPVNGDIPPVNGNIPPVNGDIPPGGAQVIPPGDDPLELDPPGDAPFIILDPPGDDAQHVYKNWESAEEGANGEGYSLEESGDSAEESITNHNQIVG